ncbi:MAG: hypothetical protein ACK47M_25190, partial [Caldilinea sp.]
MLQKCRRSDPAVLSGPSIWRLRIAATLHHPTVDAARSGVSSSPNNLHSCTGKRRLRAAATR